MIIAEIGMNFEHPGEAMRLIHLAKENGASLAKFQLFDSMKVHGKKIPQELTFEQAKWLFDYGKSIDMEVFFSVFDVEKVKWCEEIGVKRYKIAASKANTLSIIDAIDKTRKSTIISRNRERPGKAQPHHCDTKFLYCVSEYPTQMDRVSFSDIYFDWDEWQGFSDHTIGLDASKIALARGAEIIEKHFAIDHETSVDAEWSMTPDELKELVRWEKVCKQAL
ncbi:hypothetical protein LCGC14_0773100 [marine sediment metagenome]|uniref:PseI/NeuA/B-like domain-containing protein n=1 Tax=marine sediment metagenome TaxID=412755 RepID=A0A0F9QHK1_9ZZZZ